jgi:hypothetical protein
LALGEGLFPVSLFPGLPSPSVALGEAFPECFGGFPECFWHSGKGASPVVLVEGTYTIFISGSAGVFTLDLKSRKVKKVVGESAAYYFVILPYKSFYTPGINLDSFL